MITIAGGTGTVGSKLARKLLAEGARIRVLTRDPSAHTDLFGGDPRAELTAIDFDDPASLRSAFRGADRAFVSSGTSPRQVTDEKALIDAAVQAEVPYLVGLSVGGLGRGVANPVLDWHAEIDAHLAAQGVPFALLRPATFTDTTIQIASNFVPSGSWGGHAGQGRLAPVDTRDIADVATVVLLDGPGRHAGRAYDLNGPDAITMHELAGLLSKALGRAVHYEDRTPEEHRAVLESAGLPALMVDVLIGLENVTRASLFGSPTTAVHDLTGHEARGVEPYIRENLAAFTVSAAG
jgi:NAD(P)H dehydrogenase (quinone)